MSLSRRILVVAFFALSAAIADQASKSAMLHILTEPPRIIEITSFFSLRLGFNTGVSFGLFSDTLENWPLALGAFKLGVALVFIVWAVRTKFPLERAGLGLIAGGALGNAIDRWRNGAVTDFLDFYWKDWRWPTFNFADVAIVTGVGLLMLSAILDNDRGENARGARAEIEPRQ